ncbi:MAG: hypothetical protein ACYTEQ_25715 [Planctomycetota bacterium]|jgi:hypothetical protein
MRLVVVVYHHNHGVDTLPILLRDTDDDTHALTVARKDMVDQYGEEDVRRDEEVYGGFDIGSTIVNGTSYTVGDKVYTFNIVEEVHSGQR